MLQVLQDAVNNPDLAEPFTILRNPGKFAAGGFVPSAQQTIKAYGTVGLASNKDMEVVPEGDRIHEIRMFHSSTQMLPTSEDAKVTADVLVWRGISYRVVAVVERGQRGYFAALAARMAGQ